MIELTDEPQVVIPKSFAVRLRNFDFLWKLLDLFRVLSRGRTGSYLRLIKIPLEAVWSLAWSGVKADVER